MNPDRHFPNAPEPERCAPRRCRVGGLALLWTASMLGPPVSRAADLWVDQAEASGLVFEHENGARGHWYFPEINGSGVALFDADNDGDLDVYFAQGKVLGRDPDDASEKKSGTFFRNDLGADGLRFVDVTATCGIKVDGYAMAVAAADFDNDGWTDLYVGAYGAGSMWRHLGAPKDGRPRFEDVTERWQAAERRWTAALAVFDFDRDGRLDLYLGNYLRFEPARHKTCTSSIGRQDYCHPSSYPAEHDLFFHNRLVGGQTRFVDLTRRAFGSPEPEPTLGLTVLDLDGDGRLDLYTAHDDRPNRMWRNRFDDAGSSTETYFQDDALLAGTAVNGRGEPEASMGVTAGDVDGDGDTDLFMSHLTGQSNTLYINRGGVFSDETRRRGLGAPSLPFTGFGTVFLDADLDGDLDLFVADGAVQVIETQRRAGEPHPFHQTNQYFENLGDGRFVDASERAGTEMKRSETSRGLAVGDVDNDGDPDLVVSNNGGPARLLINGTRAPGSDGPPFWLGLRLVDRHGRDHLGAVATLSPHDAPKLVRRVGVDGSYASSSDPRLLFGLGRRPPRLDHLSIAWPDGLVESFPVPALGSYTTLRHGTGTPVDGVEPTAEPTTVPTPRKSSHVP